MSSVSRRLSASILSMSLLTVMAGAAVAPALGAIQAHFADSPHITLQFIVSMPALFIILANIAFPYISRLLKTKTLALLGLLMYVVFGTLPFFLNSLPMVLLFRALLGLSVGIIMPLSTGLIAFYFSSEEQSRLMGLSGAMNQMGGVIATLVAGLLAEISWNAAFLVYLFGLASIILVARILPNDRLKTRHPKDAVGIHSSVQPKATSTILQRLVHYRNEILGMFLLMMLFFVYPSNFAIISRQTTPLSSTQITLIMVGLDLVAFFVGIIFGHMMQRYGKRLGKALPIIFGAAYLIMSITVNIPALLAACILIGIGSGIGVPYYNTIAALEAGSSAATQIMPLLSASLYAGQFLSPLIISGLGTAVFGDIATAPYMVAVGVAIIYFVVVVRPFDT